jgi:hypothetical protein
MDELTAWIDSLDDDAREFFEERAAIAEFDALMPRPEAELAAKALTEGYLARRNRGQDA